jgi:hypothetical protein
MGVEIEGLLLVRVEESQDLDEDLAHLGVELDVVLGFLTYTIGEQF